MRRALAALILASVPLCAQAPSRASIERLRAFANAHFAEPGRAGSKTDRGCVYLALGPPDRITADSGASHRYASEGWRYLHLAGFDSPVIYDFIQHSPATGLHLAGVYRLSDLQLPAGLPPSSMPAPPPPFPAASCATPFPQAR